MPNFHRSGTLIFPVFVIWLYENYISSSLAYSSLILTDETHTQETISKHYKERVSKTKTKIAMSEMLLNEILRDK